eukprot:3573797-Pyramimonas_sp.AAC.1
MRRLQQTWRRPHRAVPPWQLGHWPPQWRRRWIGRPRRSMWAASEEGQGQPLMQSCAGSWGRHEWLQ